MNKQELVTKVAEQFKTTRKAAVDMVDFITNTMIDTVLSGEDVRVNRIKLALVDRAARKGRNPQTGEEIEIPAKKVVKFKLLGN